MQSISHSKGWDYNSNHQIEIKYHIRTDLHFSYDRSNIDYEPAVLFCHDRNDSFCGTQSGKCVCVENIFDALE